MALRKLLPRKGGRGAPAESMRGWLEPMQRFFEGARPWEERRWPALELEETPKELIVQAKVPGMSRDDLRIEVTENSLTIAGCRSLQQERRRHGGLSRREASQSFMRRLALPAGVKTAEARASLREETLEIRLPRVKERVGRRIGIE